MLASINEPLPGVSDHHISIALRTAESSSKAIANLYKTYKATDAKFSIPFICRKARIPSVGYFSDVMSEKRRLHIKHKEGIVRAFALKGTQAKLLRTLIAIDNEKDVVKRDALRKKLGSLRKSLSVAQREFARKATTQDFFFALEVFCAFGLFKNQPTLTDLAGYFSSYELATIERAIATLEDLGLVKWENDRITITLSQVDFTAERISAGDFLRLAFEHGLKSLDTWYDKPEVSYFTSLNISVKKGEYEKRLVSIRDEIDVIRSELETDDADMLVRLNCQIYPIT